MHALQQADTQEATMFCCLVGQKLHKCLIAAAIKTFDVQFNYFHP